MTSRAAAWLLGAAPLLLAAPVVAQTADTVRGTVVDDSTAAPIAGARIEASPAGVRSETGSDGRFRIVATAGDTLRIRALGYRGAQLVIASSATELRVSLLSAPAVLQELVVTASRHEERAAETAVHVTVVSADQIAASAASSVDRVLEELPGIQMLPNEPTGSDLSIRGIDGARVLVLVDGEPTFGNLLENRDLSRLSTIAADRIEVVKGPLSAQYGSDALGGVVNLITASPTGPLSLGATARVGNGGRRELGLSGEGGGRFGYRINLGGREDESVASVDQSTDALERVYDLRGSLRYEASKSLKLRGDLALLRERQRWQLSADGFNGFNDNMGATGWVEAAGALGSGSWNSRFFFEDYSHRFRQAQALDPIASDTAPTQTESMLKLSAGYTTRLGSHGLSGGVDLSHRSIDSPGKVDGTLSDRMVEGYAQDAWSRGRFLLTPAARLSWNSRWGTAVTPSLSAAWEQTPSLRWRAAVGRGFRAPSFKELAWDFSNPLAGYIILGNPDLSPERSWQYSAGATWAIAPSLVADAEVYRNDIRDLIQLTVNGTDSTTGLVRYTPLNVANARTQGIEFGLKWSSTAWLVSAGYHYLDATDRSTGERLDRRAANEARLALGRRIGLLQGLRGDLAFVYTGSAPALQADGSEGTQEAFLATNFQFRLGVRRGLDCSAGVDNLFDVHPAGWNGVLGRRYYFGLTTTWQP
ncbi:MAG TPA: TonB-dependent receptor [Gemmatimonadales bacterium]|nr:TonB-dependent receptor [Gemmatimonadales bacterium]